MPQTHCEGLLATAARKFDGGACSFPLATTVPVYEPPNLEYERVFLDAKSSQTGTPPARRSAGWIVPDERSVCKPVFVAHSLLAAIWLVRETLPVNTLSNNVWASLARAAEALATSQGAIPPPSAQKPTTNSVPLPLATPSTSAPNGKRASSPLGAASPKRIQQDGSEPGHRAGSAGSEEDDPDSLLALAQPAYPSLHHTRGTNNTMRAEKRRLEKQSARRLQQRYNLGLHVPSDNAPRQEHAAYTSITQETETVVAWIIKQPYSDHADFFTAAKTPYYTACTLLEKAHVLGNASSRVHAAQFLQAWRKRGSPFQGESNALVASQAVSSAQSQMRGKPSINPADHAFRFAWEICDQSEGEMATSHIKYRWAAALLGQAYQNKIEQIRESDKGVVTINARSRNGKGKVRTEAANHLLALLYTAPTEQDRRLFKSRVNRGTRWYTIGQTLGWGSFCLVPYDLISNTWIEHTLRVPELAIWLALVKKVNPDVYEAAQVLDSWLGPDGISGGAISSKTPLSIEAEPAMPIYNIEEIRDSEEDSDTDEPSQSQVLPNSCTPISRARQLTLSELFHPIEQ